MAVIEQTATVQRAETRLSDVEGVVDAWLAGAGSSSDRAELEERLRLGRALVNRIEVGFSRDAIAFDRTRDLRDESTTDWMRRELRMTANASNAALRVGSLADQLPLSVAAAEDGHIGFNHLNLMAATAECARQLPLVVPADELEMAGDVRPPLWTETELLAKAQTQPIGKFATTCLHAQHALDARIAVETAQGFARCQRITLHPRSDGTVGIQGWLDPENGALLCAALEPLAAPREAHDTRRPALRMAEALGELASIAMDCAKLPARGGVRPHLSVTTSLDALCRLQDALAAEADWGVTFADQTVRRLACDATVSRVLVDSQSIPIDVGRAVRVVPVPTRRALVVRDRGCRWPGCGVPPSRCHAHHLEHWINGGETNMSDLVLLCRRHHRMLHEGDSELAGDPNGELTVQRWEDGTNPRHWRRMHNWLRDRGEDADTVEGASAARVAVSGDAPEHPPPETGPA